jgi:bifunctional non-homologous end joining protein LigD
MLASVAGLPGNSDGYVFEAKWDGIRALARIDGTAELFSRRSTNLTGCFPEITDALASALTGRTAILDGEIVALDRHARPSFELVMRRMRSTRPQARLLTAIPAMFFVFDMLYLDGADVMRQPYLKRRALLDSLNLTTKPVMTSPFWTGIASTDMFDVVRDMGLEGLVCKRASSTYQPGRRSNAWIKSVVRHRAPMVVGGWVPVRTGNIGSLLVGAHDVDGRLLYCGHVGFGFNAQTRRELCARFSKIGCTASPFAAAGPHDGVNWVQPVVVVNVDYREFTGRLRHPSVKGIADVTASGVLLPMPSLNAPVVLAP